MSLVSTFLGTRYGVHQLSHGVVCVVLCLAVLVQYRRVTDGETDRRTDVHRTTAHTALAYHRAWKN